jgi:hypothetical protein
MTGEGEKITSYVFEARVGNYPTGKDATGRRRNFAEGNFCLQIFFFTEKNQTKRRWWQKKYVK